MKLSFLSFIICLLLQHYPPPPPPSRFDLQSTYVIQNAAGNTPGNATTRRFGINRLRKAYDLSFENPLKPIRGFVGYAAIVEAIEGGIILPSRNSEWKQIVEYTKINYGSPSEELTKICGLAFQGSGDPGNTVYNDATNLCYSVPVPRNLSVILILSFLFLFGIQISSQAENCP